MSNLVPPDVRRLVTERADYHCEYCLIAEADSFAPHQVDRVIALKHRGSSVLENLAYSCAVCNMHKGSDVTSYDPESDRVVRLFHPRRDAWTEHFRLESAHIVGLTEVVRVTVTLLQLNRQDRLVERELALRPK